MHELTTAVVVASGVLLAVGLYCKWYYSSRSTNARKGPPPHPKWKLGEKQSSPFKDAGYLTLDPTESGPGEYASLLISGIAPRPIAFVSSLNAEGGGNLAPFSYFGAMGHDPPCIAFSVCRSRLRDGGEKDTAHNVLQTKEFSVNIISEWFVDTANYCCAPLIPDINEMELVNLTPVPSVKIKPPRVEESAFQMECILKHHYDIMNRKGDVHATIFIGEVVLFHVNKGVAANNPSGKVVIELEKYQPMSRLGGNSYGQITSYFDLSRPDRTV